MGSSRRRSGCQRRSGRLSLDDEQLGAERDGPASTVDRRRPGGATRTPDLGDEVTSTAVLDDVAGSELFSCDDHVGTPFRVYLMYE